MNNKSTSKKDNDFNQVSDENPALQNFFNREENEKCVWCICVLAHKM